MQQRPSLGSRVDVFEKLSVRYFRSDAPRAVARLIQALHAGDPMRSGHIAYTMLLWNDALVFLLGSEWLSPRLDGPPFSSETDDWVSAYVVWEKHERKMHSLTDARYVQ